MSRVPPHDLDAERACLGAMLNTSVAIKEALDETSSPSFYAPGHGHVFAAVASLHYRSASVDLVTVASELGAVLEHLTVPVRDGGERRGKEALSYLAAAVPNTFHARSYAHKIEELAACRRAMALAEDLGIAGQEQDLTKVDELLAGADEAIAAPVGLDSIDGPEELGSITEAPEVPKEYVLAGTLARGERLGLCATEGVGKTTLLRQVVVLAASGIHPFTLDSMPVQRCLHIDLENEEGDLDNEPGTGYRALIRRAGPAYQGCAYRRARTEGIDLRARRDVRWLEHQIRQTSPALLVIGPLYKMFRGRPGSGVFSDEAAQEAIAALDVLRVRYNLALIIEGHAPYGADNDRAGVRWKGSQLWTAWLNFTRSLVLPDPKQAAAAGRAMNATDVDLTKWRYDRHDGRTWPTRLVHGDRWPWQVPGITEPTLLDEPPLDEPEGY